MWCITCRKCVADAQGVLLLKVLLLLVNVGYVHVEGVLVFGEGVVYVHMQSALVYVLWCGAVGQCGVCTW